MPSPHRRLRAADVESFIRTRCFAPAEHGRIGVELERLVVSAGGRRHAGGARADHTAVARAVAAVGPLPGGSRVTFEPGGQVEVSSPPHRGPDRACAVTSADLAVVDPAVRRLGLELVGAGLHPLGEGRQVVDHPRYRAMAAYFDAQGGCGRTMMCSTASLQVNVDIGDEGSQARRWRLAHRLGPVLLGAFANSPLTAGVANGSCSGRAGVWAGIDASRTASADSGSGSGAGEVEDPARAWARYTLAARVMMLRVSDNEMVPVVRPLPFARWIDEGHELGFPTLEDLEYHLSTLFPPVRARGWLELRMIDSLPDPWWQVAVAVCAALFDDAEAAEEAARATVPTAGLWTEAARFGLAHPALGAAARACFASALDALPRLGAGADLVSHVAAFVDRFVDRGRCPADDLLDAAVVGRAGPVELRTTVAATAEAR